MRRPVAESKTTGTTTEPTTMDHGEQKLNRSFPENVAFSSFCISESFQSLRTCVVKLFIFEHVTERSGVISRYSAKGSRRIRSHEDAVCWSTR